jgi:hypothetical protein
MTDLFSQGFGLEEAAMGATKMLIEGLNDELVAVQDSRADADQELDDLRGIEYFPVELEAVALEDFHLGHDPSLLEDGTTLDRYPSISVMSYRAAPAPTDTGDQYSEYRDSLYVELLVKASPQEGAEVCDKRAWRTANAVHNVIARDRTLGGTTYEIEGAPTCLVSEVFTRAKNASEGHGEPWFWQAARIEYGVDKYSPFDG